MEREIKGHLGTDEKTGEWAESVVTLVVVILRTGLQREMIGAAFVVDKVVLKGQLCSLWLTGGYS